MAEVVGAVAAIVQFVDVALRLSSCLERFCSDVRNVPRRFVQLQIDLRQQIEIAQQIQSHRLPGFATAVASSTFDTPLVEYIDLAEELCKTLEGLLGRQNDGVLRRGWDAICSIRKKEEVASICDRLEQKKSTLSLWLEAANLKLTSSIAATTDQTRLDVSDTLTLVKTVDNTSNSIATNTAQLLPHIEHIDRTLATTSTTTEHILHDTQRILRGYDADVLTRESSHQSTAMILANTEQIMAAIEKLTLSPGKHSPHAQPGYVTDHMYVGSSASQQIQQSTVNHRRRPQRCRCRTVSTARRWQPLSILRFTRTFRTQHFSYCPDYRNSEQSLEITMQIVPPSWLLCHTIDFGTHVRNWSTMNPFSMSPIVVGTSRLVDSRTSPAFLAIANSRKEVRELREAGRYFGQRHIPTQLHNTLQRMFDNAEASALDVDSDGRTVLNETVHLFVADINSSCVGEYAALFQCLVDRGADPNVIRDLMPDHTFEALTHYGGTTCDQLMDPMLFYLSAESPIIPGLRAILELFVKAEGHTSKPFFGDSRPGYRCISFRDDVTQLNIFEDQIDIMDLGDLVPIILQRQEKHFHHIIKRTELSILNRKSPINGLAPIHFAVLWPTGLKMLMERGVDINIEDNHGRRPVHLAVALGIVESVQCLLNADCGLFTPAEDYSLLQYALFSCEEGADSQILFQLIQALCDRHTRLRDMAISHLPPSVSAKLELTLGELQERRAPLIMETLLSYGIDVPPALELDGKGLYHSIIDFSRHVQMTPTAANELWTSGFHRFDEPNDNGWTPFLQSWFCHSFDMIDWFVSRGVKLDSKHTDAPLTALHLYAKGTRCNITHPKDISTTRGNHMESIQKELGIPYDDCTCACSPEGCTPAKFLFGPDYLHRWEPTRKHNIRKYIEHVNPPKPLLNRYIYHCTRLVLFDFLDGEHTCCSIEVVHASSWELSRPSSTNRWRRGIEEPRDYYRNHFPIDEWEHRQYCNHGLPVPHMESLEALRAPDVFNATLETAMSHYDKMDRPDTMSAEEQVFEYINWISKEGHLDIDASNGCEHDNEVIKRCSMRW